MSLTFILKKQQGRTYLKKWFRFHFPKPGLKEKKEIVISPKQPHGSYSGEIGTAFDYLFRFSLERLNKETYKDNGYWVAESGLKILLKHIDSKKTKKISIGYYGEKEVERLKFRTFILTEFNNAQNNHKTFQRDGKLTVDLIKSSIILAKLDVVYRANIIDSSFDEIEQGKIVELQELLGIVNWDNFKTKKHCMLNPTFGEGSTLVGGADADLILDDTLIDIKTNRSFKLERNDLNQIIGYCLLAIIGELDIKIENIGIYFARYGYLWQFPLTDYYELDHLPKLADEFSRQILDINLDLIAPSNTRPISPVKSFGKYVIDKNNFKCPYCESKSFIGNGKIKTKFRYKCKACKKSFTSAIKTSL